jgi:hypothetical protein
MGRHRTRRSRSIMSRCGCPTSHAPVCSTSTV